MPDQRFVHSCEPISVADALQIAQRVDENAALLVEAETVIRRVAAPAEPDLSDAVIFCETSAALAAIGSKSFGLLLISAELAERPQGQGAILLTASPKLAFARIAERLHVMREFNDGPPPTIANSASLCAGAVVGAGARIGDRAKVGPNAVIGPGVEIGPDSVIGAGVSIYCAQIGANVRIHAGARVGESGFGFIKAKTGLVGLPQLGKVMIGDHVEIGANSTIDRAALGETVIGEGTKIDNLVQIGHNVTIGRHCVFAAMTGVSGSVIFGDAVLVGGQSGFAEGVKIGAGVSLAARSGVICDVPAGEVWGGAPARPRKQWMRELAMLARLAKKK